MYLRFLFAVPVLMPAAMTMLNIVSFTMGLVFEGRFRESAAKFTVLYAATIPAASRNDLTPFMAVLSQR